MSAEYAIQIENLRKEYGEVVAIDQLNLQVKAGEVFGFLGPNGSGKTTTIKILLGLAEATAGSARIFDKPVGDPETRRLVGFLPEHFRFHGWLKANEFLRLHGRLHGLSDSILDERIPVLLEKVRLSTQANGQIHTFSKGMLQRIGLAQVLVNDPSLVFLDEPTSGLDPGGRLLVRDLIEELRDQGTCVFLNSHLLSEVEVTCDRVAFIKQGTLLQVREVDAILEGENTVTVRADSWSEGTLEGLARFGEIASQSRNAVTLKIPSLETIPGLTRWLVEMGVEIQAVIPEHVSLEDLFIQIVGTDGEG